VLITIKCMICKYTQQPYIHDHNKILLITIKCMICKYTQQPYIHDHNKICINNN